MLFGKDKKTLSYSAISLWYKDKDLYRKRYFTLEAPKITKYTLFGKTAEEHVYKGTMPDVPLFNERQYKIFMEIEGVPIVAYLDSFDSTTLQFVDYKSSLKPWTQVMVQELDQLPFYSMLIKKKHGKVHKTALLTWLETRLVSTGALLSNGDMLELTGKTQTFSRNIAEWERKRMVKYITDAAEQISEDYKHWKGL